ncbi:hypothetical protein AX16_005034 [Volvariella volvacea WC 439]|nr:hypothetical protein AX16_005034 [Volvariella volvacea WC 439]
MSSFIWKWLRRERRESLLSRCSDTGTLKAPTDIWEAIAFYLPRHDLYHLCLTCSSFLETFQPTLYHTLTLKSERPNARSTCALLGANCYLASHVRIICLENDVPSRYWDRVISSLTLVIRGMNNLEALCLDGYLPLARAKHQKKLMKMIEKHGSVKKLDCQVTNTDFQFRIQGLNFIHCYCKPLRFHCLLTLISPQVELDICATSLILPSWRTLTSISLETLQEMTVLPEIFYMKFPSLKEISFTFAPAQELKPEIIRFCSNHPTLKVLRLNSMFCKERDPKLIPYLICPDFLPSLMSLQCYPQELVILLNQGVNSIKRLDEIILVYKPVDEHLATLIEKLIDDEEVALPALK